jgi:hypothetical protein
MTTSWHWNFVFIVPHMCCYTFFLINHVARRRPWNLMFGILGTNTCDDIIQWYRLSLLKQDVALGTNRIEWNIDPWKKSTSWDSSVSHVNSTFSASVFIVPHMWYNYAASCCQEMIVKFNVCYHVIILFNGLLKQDVVLGTNCMGNSSVE